VIDGNIRAMTSPDVAEINGQVLNLAFGGTTTVNDLFYGIRNGLSKYEPSLAKMEPSYKEKRKGDILHSHANIKKVQTYLKFHPSTTLQEGLDQTIDWYLNKDTS
jgi:UDP-N-acetylglucosamine 4-epimerase